MDHRPIRAIFFDIDGTLFSHRTKRVPPSAWNALERLHGKGVKLFLSTGRHIKEMSDLEPVPSFPWDGYVMLNGQYCTDGRTAYSRHPLDRSDVEGLIRFSRELDIPCMFLEEDRMYISHHNDLVRRVLRDIHTSLTPLGDMNEALRNPIYMAVAYGGEDKKRALLAGLPGLRALSWHPDAFDLIRADGGKDKGILDTCAHFGFDPAECAAFGDGQNDIDMLRCVGLGVAMGNASQEVKAACRYTAPDIDDDGLARALEALGILP